VSVSSAEVDLAAISLFNSTGGGILQRDDRGPGTIGGLRNTDIFTHGGGSIQSFTFDGPLVFTDDTTAITFDLVLDADNPSNTTSPEGGTTISVTLNRTLMDQVYPTLNGVISSRDQFAWLMRETLIPLGAQFANRSGTTDGYALLSRETSGLTGSSIQVLNVSSTLADGKTGGLSATGTNYGSRPSVVSYWDEPFNVHSTAQIYVPIRINGTTTTLEISRDTVDQALGTTTGAVTSANDLVSVLNAALQAQNVGVIATNAGGYIRYEADETIHKASGSKTSIGIGPASDGFGDLPNFGLLDIDITATGANLDYYLSGIEAMLGKLADADAMLEQHAIGIP
jgi:flagellin